MIIAFAHTGSIGRGFTRFEAQKLMYTMEDYCCAYVNIQ